MEYPLAAVDTLPSPAENRMLGGVSGWVGLRARVWLIKVCGRRGGKARDACVLRTVVCVCGSEIGQILCRESQGSREGTAVCRNTAEPSEADAREKRT